jgi:hypothetical protein
VRPLPVCWVPTPPRTPSRLLPRSTRSPSHLRGHLELIVPEVEQAAGPRPKDAHTYCALACVGEARRKLSVTPGPTLESRVAHARKLARVLHSLCDHYERLGAGGETPEKAALWRLGEHSARCSTCRMVDGDGANVNLPCAEGDRLYDEYRQARRVNASLLESHR